MAQITTAPSVTMEVTLTLTEAEARALEAMSGYDAGAILRVFYQHIGSHYLQPHEHGFRTLMESVRAIVPTYIDRADRARAVFLNKSPVSP